VRDGLFFSDDENDFSRHLTKSYKNLEVTDKSIFGMEIKCAHNYI